MKILSYLPGQNHSLTKKLTDREYSRREIALTCFVTGLLSATIGYTRKNAFLATGTSVFIANRILYLDLTVKIPAHTDLYSDLTVKTPVDIEDTAITPMLILSFISFCSFLGLSLKQSWVKPPAATPSTWRHSLIKTTLSLLALSTLTITAEYAAVNFGAYTVKMLDEESSARLLIIGAITASAASTFLIPRLGYLTPFAVISLCSSLYYAMQTDKALNEALVLAKKSMSYPLWLLLGASIGLLSRSLLGPKNCTPSLPLLARVPLYSMTAIVPLLYAFMRRLSEKPEELMTTEAPPDCPLEINFKKGFLQRIHSTREHRFNSYEALEDHISQSFPRRANHMYNKAFFAFIVGRHTPKKEIQAVLGELKTALDKINPK